MFYGLLDLSFWGYILTLMILTQITIASVTIFLHRYQAHRALELHPIVSHFFRLWLWLTTGMETKAWAAIHRKHHAKCETAEDPHSPIIMGLKTVLFYGTELYRKEGKCKETLERYGQGTPDDWLERNVYSKYSSKGIFITLALNIILFGVPGITMWAIQMAWIPFFAAGIVNGVGHYFGYRNFECNDAATNIIPLGIFIGGEELHNNHHTYPTSAKLSVKWWEFDMGWLYIRILSFLGLAKPKRTAPKATIIQNKQVVDADTVSSIISNRVHLISMYTKKVLMPVFSRESKKVPTTEQGVWSKVKWSLKSADILVDDKDKKSLEKFLENNKVLHSLYSYRQQLQGIWEKTTASQKELIDALTEWCKSAEESGIDLLQDFVAYVKGYHLAKS